MRDRCIIQITKHSICDKWLGSSFLNTLLFEWYIHSLFKNAYQGSWKILICSLNWYRLLSRTVLSINIRRLTITLNAVNIVPVSILFDVGDCTWLMVYLKMSILCFMVGVWWWSFGRMSCRLEVYFALIVVLTVLRL